MTADTVRACVAAALLTAGAAAAQSPLEERDPRELRYEDQDDEYREEEEQLRKPPAVVLPDRPLMLRLGSALTWDSNFFRTSDAREEWVSSAHAGLSMDKAYAQQRFRADVTGTLYRYENFPQLDFEALNYLGAWDWRLGPRIGGTLSATRAQGLADYGEFRNPGERNVRTTDNYSLGADAWLFGGWHLTGALVHLRNRYSVPFVQEGSYRVSGGEAGAKWVAPSANWLAFNLRSLEGRYLDRALNPVFRIDDGFRRREAEALVSWRFTGKSSLEGRAAHVYYRSNHFEERDFSGIAARLRYLWQASAKLGFTAALGREIEPWTDVSASHRVEERMSVGSLWQAAARTTLRVEALRTENEFRDPLPGFAGGRRDIHRSLQLEAEWRALRNASLKAAAQRYRQSSNDPTANYSGSQLTFSVSLLL